MGFAILGQHREHFAQNGYVEFESLLSAEEVKAASEAVQRSVGRPPLSAWESMRVGRDLWRGDPVLSKLARSRKIAEVAAELVRAKPLRLAYDQLLWHTGRTEPAGIALDEPWTLSDLSAFQGVQVGVILCLEAGATASLHLPKRPGSGVYLSAQTPIDWNEIQKKNSGMWWMVVYGKETMLYILNPRDPHVHLPKQYGYVFGDRLRDDDFPKLVR